MPEKEIMMLTVRDLMTIDPGTVQPDTLINDVLHIIKVEGCRQLPVVNDQGQVTGIVTDRDVRLAMNSPIILHGRWQDEELLLTATASSCMTSNPIVTTPDTLAYRAAEMLSAFKFGALPVVENGQLVGIITVTDFLDRFATGQPLANSAQ